MDDKENQLLEFLQKVPDRYLYTEWARRVGAKNKNRKPHKKVRKCRFCYLSFGAREMRVHTSKEHPGGTKNGWKIIKHETRGRPKKLVRTPRKRQGKK